VRELRFDGQVAVVTGAGGGLGREHARLLAARGARVVVNDTGGSVTGRGSRPGAAQEATDEIVAGGGEAIASNDSVTTREGGQAIIDRALDTWGRVDILVNNAGIVDDVPFDEMTDDRLQPLLDVHLRGAFNVTHPAWNAMRARGFGRIVNTCSAAGILGSVHMSNYAAAKTGLIGMTRVLAAEGASLGIKINAIAPIAATRMLDYSLGSVTALGDPEAAAAAEHIMRPFLDRLDPVLVSPVMAFLAHADCPVSGEIYTVGAGHVARFFIGRTLGYYNPTLSIEDVAAHFGEVRDLNGYTVPDGPGDEMAELYQTIFAE
jgi:NAD(P)-dependent dehydrogenase (short-subunit alcohol dehydrogenase family)